MAWCQTDDSLVVPPASVHKALRTAVAAARASRTAAPSEEEARPTLEDVRIWLLFAPVWFRGGWFRALYQLYIASR